MAPNDRTTDRTTARPSTRTTPRTTNRGEEIEQARVVRWSHKRVVRDLMPALAWLHHSPNGGKRDAFTGAQMKALGVKPGFPDLILPAWSHDRAHPGLVLEMKSATGSASDSQKEWQAHFLAQGWQHRLARSAEEARSTLCQHLGIDPAAAPAME